MSASNCKIIDIVFNPCETIKTKELNLSLDEVDLLFRYQFNIQLSLREKYEKTILEAGCSSIKESNGLKAVISSDTLKQYKLTIYSKEYPLPPGMHPLNSHLEIIVKDFQKGSYELENKEYREKIRLGFKVVSSLSNHLTKEVDILENNFCYDLYLEPGESAADCTLSIDQLQASFIK